jgi:hypothetical protein
MQPAEDALKIGEAGDGDRLVGRALGGQDWHIFESLGLALKQRINFNPLLGVVEQMRLSRVISG